jgi:hypothetical protein
MRRKSLLYLARSAVASVFGILSDEARAGWWWEIDLAIVILAGSFILGLSAWVQL